MSSVAPHPQVGAPHPQVGAQQYPEPLGAHQQQPQVGLSLASGTAAEKKALSSMDADGSGIV
jgi:hypothetical protein